jgi:hypothetical protein
MNDRKKWGESLTTYLIMIPIVILMVILIRYPMYKECKAHGFSTFYCLMSK